MLIDKHQQCYTNVRHKQQKYPSNFSLLVSIFKMIQNLIIKAEISLTGGHSQCLIVSVYEELERVRFNYVPGVDFIIYLRCYAPWKSHQKRMSILDIFNNFLYIDSNASRCRRNV